MELILCLIAFFFVWGIPMMKEWLEDVQYRDECARKGQETYWSHTGQRYTSNNQKVTDFKVNLNKDYYKK